MTDRTGDTNCSGCTKINTCDSLPGRRLLNRIYDCNTQAHSIKVTQLALSGDGRHTNGCKNDPVYPRKQQ